MGFTILAKTISMLIFLVISFTNCCDLEDLFNEKEISIEDALVTSDIAFRGFSTRARRFKDGGLTDYFDLITIYKGEAVLNRWRKLNNYFRKINVTFLTRTGLDCLLENEVPKDYIVFANLLAEEIRAEAVLKWNENADVRVWAALGWSQWSDWTTCSVTCSTGIQQRTRHCLESKCLGFNIQQRHCNMFSCNNTVAPLELKDGKFFHPARQSWQTIPERPSAWRLTPESYIWIPSALLFPEEKDHNIPKEFSLAASIRILNDTLGTVFSLRSRSKQHIYLSLEVAGSDFKIIHAAESGTDVVRIPAGLDDKQWHQIAFSIRDSSILDVYLDCEWSITEILLAHSLDVPADCDIIIGYLFNGDLEQLAIIKDPHASKLQCSNIQIPIEDPDIRFTKDGFKLFTSKNIIKSRKHRY